MTNVKAPWSEEQVDTLNRLQTSGVLHPFTCRRRGEHEVDNDILVAAVDGWACPSCDYTQDWAYDHMLDTETVNAMISGQFRPVRDLRDVVSPEVADRIEAALAAGPAVRRPRPVRRPAPDPGPDTTD